MKNLAARLAVALVTFAVGVGLTLLASGRPATRVVVSRVALEAEVVDLGVPKRRGECANARGAETLEEKAVRLAEEFVARNGYTDLPPDRGNLSYESIEWTENTDEILRFRRNTLERKAYGIRYTGRMGRPGWTVVFRYKDRSWAAAGRAARAVTVDENFENIRVEHKDFLPAGIEKKL